MFRSEVHSSSTDGGTSFRVTHLISWGDTMTRRSIADVVPVTERETNKKTPHKIVKNI